MFPVTSRYSESSVIQRLNGRNIVSSKVRRIEVFIYQGSILSLEIKENFLTSIIKWWNVIPLYCMTLFSSKYW